jgi:DNA (cytosine-5)-methyltransferase 1
VGAGALATAVPQGAPGKTFRAFVRKLERLGYVVEWRELRACDFGAPTIRKRLFLVARRDGQPIVWPTPTHGKGSRASVANGSRVHRLVDPCPSIFLTKEEAKLLV